MGSPRSSQWQSEAYDFIQFKLNGTRTEDTEWDNEIYQDFAIIDLFENRQVLQEAINVVYAMGLTKGV